MSKINHGGMAIAEGVVETIIAIAIQEVDGVISLAGASSNAFLSLITNRNTDVKGLELVPNEDGTVSVNVRIVIQYGYPLPQVAQKVREAVADALMTQLGLSVSSVDVFIDGVQFA